MVKNIIIALIVVIGIALLAGCSMAGGSWYVFDNFGVAVAGPFSDRTLCWQTAMQANKLVPVGINYQCWPVSPPG